MTWSVEPPAPIAEAEWRQGTFDMGVASVASLLFAICSVAKVMSLGGEVVEEWFLELKVSATFAKDNLVDLF